MPTIWTFVRAAAVLVGSSAALLTGGIAHADPAPAPAPAPNIPQQLISSAANAPQILQNLATFLDSVGTAGLPANADAAAMSSCVACAGFIAACWIIGLSWANAGKPGSC